MKKVLILFFAFVVLTIFVSCSPTPAQEEEGKSFDIIVPWDGIDSGAKGLTNLVVSGKEFDSGNPANLEFDFNYAASVMQCMPLFPKLRTISGISLTTSLKSVDLGFTMYGFTMKPVDKKSKINRDGIYVYYNIFESGNSEPVGIVEYYYNALTRKISYRQYVMLTLLVGPGTYNNGVLVFCLDDVSVGLDGSLAVNQLYVDGDGNPQLNTREAYADYFFTGDNMHPPYTNNLGLERRVITLKSKNGVTSSFSQPWNSKAAFRLCPWSSVDDSDSLKQLVISILGTETNYIATTPEDTAKFTAEQALAFIRLLYVNGDKAATGKWTNYEDFKKASLWEFNTTDHTWLTNSTDFIQGDLGSMIMWMSYFDLADARGSKSNRAYCNYHMVGTDTNSPINETNYGTSGWTTLLGSPSTPVNKYLMKNFMPYCLDGATQTQVNTLVDNLFSI